ERKPCIRKALECLPGPGQELDQLGVAHVAVLDDRVAAHNGVVTIEENGGLEGGGHARRVAAGVSRRRESEIWGREVLAAACRRPGARVPSATRAALAVRGRRRRTSSGGVGHRSSVVEHTLGKGEVMGSSPIGGSGFRKHVSFGAGPDLGRFRANRAYYVTLVREPVGWRAGESADSGVSIARRSVHPE